MSVPAVVAEMRVPLSAVATVPLVSSGIPRTVPAAAEEDPETALPVLVAGEGDMAVAVVVVMPTQLLSGMAGVETDL